MAKHQQNVTGHPWQNRFFSRPLDADHFWKALRYVELSPVRAGLVRDAWECHGQAPKHHWSRRFGSAAVLDGNWNIGYVRRSRLILLLVIRGPVPGISRPDDAVISSPEIRGI